MKHIPTLTVVTLALLVGAAQAQFVKGNEAVKVTAAGKKVETPPVPASVGKVCGVNDKCHASSWRMVETANGLVECTEAYARATSCRNSTYGTQKLARVWVVKRGAE